MHDVLSLLESRPELAGAVVLSELAGGPVSDSWLVEKQAHRYVVRIDNELAGTLELDRHTELEMLESVSAAGIGPEVIWASPDEGILITSYLPGPVWTIRDINDRQKLQQLALTLRQLHDLPAVGPDFNPADAVLTYAQIIETPYATKLADKAKSIAAELQHEDHKRSLCHNDLVHMNIVGENPVRLIDWEYAAVGDPLFDLAVVVRHHDLSATTADVFLQTWSPSLDKQLKERFQAFCALYDLLSELWYLATRINSGTNPAGTDRESG